MKKTLLLLFVMHLIALKQFGQTNTITYEKLLNAFGNENTSVKKVVQNRKSAAPGLYSLDSIITNNYDQNTGQFVPGRKQTFRFDDHGNTTIFGIFNWDLDATVWKNESWTEYTYDANDNQTEELSLQISSTNELDTLGKLETIFNDSNKRTHGHNYNWDAPLHQWVNFSMGEYTYDSTGNNTQRILYLWDGDDSIWKNRIKIQFVYDSIGRNTQYMLILWNSVSNKWVNDSKTEYTYDSANNVISNFAYIWDKYSSLWDTISIGRNTYDNNNNLIKESYISWDEFDNQMAGTEEVEYLYDSDGNRVEYINYDWDTITDQSQKKSKVLYQYDNNYSIDSIFMSNQAGFYFPIKSMILGSATYNFTYEPSDSSISSTDTCYYSIYGVTGVSEINTQKLVAKIYPNPSRDILNIQLGELQGTPNRFEIFTMAGQVVYNKTIKNYATIDVSGMQKGAYIVKITGANRKTMAQTIIVE